MTEEEGVGRLWGESWVSGVLWEIFHFKYWQHVLFNKALLGLNTTHPLVEAVLPVSRGFHTEHLRNKVWTFFIWLLMCLHAGRHAGTGSTNVSYCIKGHSRNIFGFAGHEL